MGQASVISRMNVKPRELNQGGTSTSEVAFSSDGTIPVLLHLPAAGQLAEANGRTTASFTVKAYGRVTGGGSTNFTLQLQYGTSVTPGSNTEIEASSGVAVNSESENWRIEATLEWDSTSNKINGIGEWQVGATRGSPTAINNQITSADPDGDVEQAFVVTATFSSGFSGNVAVLDGFELEF